MFFSWTIPSICPIKRFPLLGEFMTVWSGIINWPHKVIGVIFKDLLPGEIIHIYLRIWKYNNIKVRVSSLWQHSAFNCVYMNEFHINFWLCRAQRFNITIASNKTCNPYSHGNNQRLLARPVPFWNRSEPCKFTLGEILFFNFGPDITRAFCVKRFWQPTQICIISL